MDNIKVKEFIKTKTVLVCYIYGITKNDDGTIKLVHFYRQSLDGDKIIKGNYLTPEMFAKSMIKGERIAYAGVIRNKDGVEFMEDPSLVTIRTNDGKLCLTTASDDSESNNLLNLPEISEPKKKD